MSKAAYPYPPDEFDAPPDPDSPRGVHRAPRSAWSRWWPYLLVVVLVPALAWGVVTFLAREGRLPDLPIGTAGPSEQSPSPSAGESGTAGATTPAPAPTPTDVAPTPTEAAPALGTPVSVLNGAGVAGLAARTADKLTAAGFTAVTPGNATGSTPVASTVFYGSEDLRSTAELVARTVGVQAVQLSPADAGSGIVVVLRTDPGA